MEHHKIYTTAFAIVYPLYLKKVQKKGRTQDEVDEIICWLTGYSISQLHTQIEQQVDFTTFFAEAPQLHPNTVKITGLICGHRVETIAHPLMQQIRYLDKLIDELAKGKKMEKILRT